MNLGGGGGVLWETMMTIGVIYDQKCNQIKWYSPLRGKSAWEPLYDQHTSRINLFHYHEWILLSS